MDFDESFNFTFLDVDDSKTLTNGDKVVLDMTVHLLDFKGFSHNYSPDPSIATFDVEGTLVVGGNHSTSNGFTHGLRNITSPSTSADGMGFKITLSGNNTPNSNLTSGDRLLGDAFFQSGVFAGPFNGIKVVDNGGGNVDLSFAVWGDTRNTSSNDTGVFEDNDGSKGGAYPLGFDMFVSGSRTGPADAGAIPEPATLTMWSLMVGAFGAVYSIRRRRRR